jgi:hypothetical protein
VLVSNFHLISDSVLVVASSSIPGLLEPVTLKQKSLLGEIEDYRGFGECWCDGSFKSDIPRKLLSEQLNVSYFIVSQMNPHIAPFVHNNRGEAGDPSPHNVGSKMRGGFVASALETFLKLELKKWLRLIRELDLFPEGGIYDLFLQSFTGNVTIHLKMNRTLAWAYFHMWKDPSKKDMEFYLLEGERLTWPKLCMISNRFLLERTLRDCIISLEREESKQI